MKLQFTHFSLNRATGTASAEILGPAPASALDRAAYYGIQAGFRIVPQVAGTHHDNDCGATIPGKNLIVLVKFEIEQAVQGSVPNEQVNWPASGEYRIAFTRMLAEILAHCETDL